MITQQQVDVVRKITDIKNRILRSKDWDEIVELGNKAIDTAIPVQPNNDLYPDTLYHSASKARHIAFLTKELQWVKERSYSDIETVHFQIAASLLMLSMSFVRSGVDDIVKIAA